MPIRCVVFDLDGTLVDSAPDILDALHLALDDVGIRSDVPFTRSLIGPPVSDMLRSWGKGLAEGQISEAIAAFRRIYDSSTLPKTLPYEGIPNALSALRARGIQLYVATNKPQVATAGILNRCFAGSFEGFCCVDSQGSRRLSKVEMLEQLIATHRIDSSTAAMVGDSESDVAAGKALDWRTLAVSYGYGTLDSLLLAQPTWLANTTHEIAPLLLGG